MTILKETREAMNPPVSQRDMARRIGVSNQTISHWERPSVIPPLRLAPTIAREYGLSVARVEKAIVEMNRQAVTAGK